MAELERTEHQIRIYADDYGKRAKANRRASAASRAITTMLGVVAPTVVTYQIQAQNPSSALSTLTIIITALAGSAGALQATFRWGDAYARSLQTQLALLELESLTNFRRIGLAHLNDSTHKYNELKALHEHTVRELRRILKDDVQAEVALTMQETSKEPKAHNLSPRLPGAMNLGNQE
jgi:hypothetical protein